MPSLSHHRLLSCGSFSDTLVCSIHLTLLHSGSHLRLIIQRSATRLPPLHSPGRLPADSKRQTAATKSFERRRWPPVVAAIVVRGRNDRVWCRHCTAHIYKNHPENQCRQIDCVAYRQSQQIPKLNWRWVEPFVIRRPFLSHCWTHPIISQMTRLRRGSSRGDCSRFCCRLYRRNRAKLLPLQLYY